MRLSPKLTFDHLLACSSKLGPPPHPRPCPSTPWWCCMQPPSSWPLPQAASLQLGNPRPGFVKTWDIWVILSCSNCLKNSKVFISGVMKFSVINVYIYDQDIWEILFVYKLPHTVRKIKHLTNRWSWKLLLFTHAYIQNRRKVMTEEEKKLTH